MIKKMKGKVFWYELIYKDQNGEEFVEIYDTLEETNLRLKEIYNEDYVNVDVLLVLDEDDVMRNVWCKLKKGELVK